MIVEQKQDNKKVNIRDLADRARLRRYLKLAVVVTVAAMSAGLFSALIVHTLMGRIIHMRTEVVIPDIEGMELIRALEVLAESNLSLMKVAEKYDSGVPAGSIISQSPPPGLSVREGKAVEAVISSGGKVVFVPDLSEKSLHYSELLLRQAGLGIGGQVRTFSNTVERDHVVSQDPSAGDIVEQNTYVNLVISRGPDENTDTLAMADLIGLNVRNVDRVLGGLGLKISEITATENNDLPEGTVVNQDPPHGEPVAAETRVRITVTHRARPKRQVRDASIYHQVTPEEDESQVRIILHDDIGERLIVDGIHPAGSRIEVPVKVLGSAFFRVYYDDILVVEIPIEEESDEDDPAAAYGPAGFTDESSEDLPNSSGEMYFPDLNPESDQESWMPPSRD